MFAEAKTSAGAPSRICAANVLEPANENLAPGAIFGNASVSEAAAYTETVALELPLATPPLASTMTITSAAAMDLMRAPP